MVVPSEDLRRILERHIEGSQELSWPRNATFCISGPRKFLATFNVSRQNTPLDGKLFKNASSRQILKFLAGTYMSHLPMRSYGLGLEHLYARFTPFYSRKPHAHLGMIILKSYGGIFMSCIFRMWSSNCCCDSCLPYNCKESLLGLLFILTLLLLLCVLLIFVLGKNTRPTQKWRLY